MMYKRDVQVSQSGSVSLFLISLLLLRDFVTTSGLAVNVKQAKKKWNNLKDKHKAICLPVPCFLCFVLYT